MSGMSGIGGGVEGSHFRCETLVIDTQLSSPREDALALIELGEVMQVELDRSSGPVSLVVVMRHGETVGGLASPLIARLRQCMNDGMSYTATVTYKSEALVRLRIYPSIR